MSFVFAGALAVALLVVGPLVAHLLRRHRTDERPFAPTRLVPPTAPIARHRQRVDDRALYAVRTIQILALALLGAAPFVRCTGLSLERNAGASVALVVVLDDSMSMRAKINSVPRWDRAHRAARDLIDGAKEGDAIAIVLAGAPARIALATTTDLIAARTALDAVGPADRGTDLDGALDLARTLLRVAPQTDHRIVLLSDQADGHADGRPLGEGADTELWIPLEAIVKPAHDCAIIRADRTAHGVLAHVACSDREAAAGRTLELRGAKGVLARAELGAALSSDIRLDIASPSAPSASASPSASVAANGATATNPAPGTPIPGAPSNQADPRAGEHLVLTGDDAIDEDNEAAVLSSNNVLIVGVVDDAANGKLATGGAPPVEQALSALDPELRIRPLPIFPDHEGDLESFAALVVDDPAGFTPEARRAVSSFLDRGGVIVVMLGPRSAQALLGASFEPLFNGSVGWSPSPVPGLARASFDPRFVLVTAGLDDLHPKGRATFAPNALAKQGKVLATWSDGAPWLFERRLGQGLALVLTSPASADLSDFPLRPAFVALLQEVLVAARTRAGARRTDAGDPWLLESARSATIVDPDGKKHAAVEQAGRLTFVPDRIGAYELTLDGHRSTRLVAPIEKELDFRPRAVAPSARSSAHGDVRARIDLSRPIAFALLSLFVAELLLRLLARRGGSSPESPPSPQPPPPEPPSPEARPVLP